MVKFTILFDHEVWNKTISPQNNWFPPYLKENPNKAKETIANFHIVLQEKASNHTTLLQIVQFYLH
jgi:hypothetical protein